jgi:hypothetical protein
MANPTYYTVTESFVGQLNGVEVEYHAGEVVEAADPAVKKMPLHFVPLIVRGGVEQGTAAPGEKRQIRLPGRPRKATAAEEKAIAATVKAEAEPEPEPVNEGKPITTDSFRRP